MFYEELYEELGKLFYSIAAADGKVATAEEMALRQAIRDNWESLEDSTDAFGTDKSAMISFAFDYADKEGIELSPVDSFASFFRIHHEKFTPAIIDNILRTAKAIASAFHNTNIKEQMVLKKLETVLLEKHRQD